MTPRGRRPHVVGELLVVLGLLRVYDLVRDRAAPRRAGALDHGADVLRVERWLHADVERPASTWAAAHSGVEQIAAHFYQYAHGTVTMAVLGWCWWACPGAYRWARTSLVLINVVGLVTFFLLPVAPPRLLPGSGVPDGLQLAGYHTVGVGPVAADEYGAMPSLHIAWAVWVSAVVLVCVGHRAVRAIACSYPVLTAVVVVVTGNHYVLDLVAGACVALLAVAHRRPVTALQRCAFAARRRAPDPSRSPRARRTGCRAPHDAKAAGRLRPGAGRRGWQGSPRLLPAAGTVVEVVTSPPLPSPGP